MTYPITNFTEEELPLIISNELIFLLTHLKNVFKDFQSYDNNVGNILDLTQWSNWSTPRKYAVDRKLLSISLSERKDIKEALERLTNGGVSSGAFHYPPDGWMGWHTNHSGHLNDTRLYITHNDAEGSQFLYRRGDVTMHVKEPMGWSVKYFDVSTPFWHAVISNANRHSFGFRYLK